MHKTIPSGPQAVRGAGEAILREGFMEEVIFQVRSKVSFQTEWRKLIRLLGAASEKVLS